MTPKPQNIVLARYAFGREDELIDLYILEGPSSLRQKLGITEGDWQMIFDYLVFEQNLLYKTVTANTEFFLDSYIKYGMTHVREILEIGEDKYDFVWDPVFDFLAISNEGLYYHVLEHRERYSEALKLRGGIFLRKILRINKDKYSENWLTILDLLLHTTCDRIFSQQTFEHGLRTFSIMMNQGREQRAIVLPKETSAQ